MKKIQLEKNIINVIIIMKKITFLFLINSILQNFILISFYDI